MRWSVILILICLFFLGLSLSTQSQLVSTGTVDQRTVTKIQQLKNDFIKTTDPLYTFHITELSQARVDPALLDPGSNLPRTHIVIHIVRFKRYFKECKLVDFRVRSVLRILNYERLCFGINSFVENYPVYQRDFF